MVEGYIWYFRKYKDLNLVFDDLPATQVDIFRATE